MCHCPHELRYAVKTLVLVCHFYVFMFMQPVPCLGKAHISSIEYVYRKQTGRPHSAQSTGDSA